jgi:hypothetical protein
MEAGRGKDREAALAGHFVATARRPDLTPRAKAFIAGELREKRGKKSRLRHFAANLLKFR